MSLAELRKELKDLRKKSMPTPVSRMKKAECAAEIERMRGIHHSEVKKVEEVMKKEEVPAKTAKKVKVVQEVAHAKVEEGVKKTKGVRRSAPEVSVPMVDDKKPKDDKKPAKGSEEMKARMAALREKRKMKE